MPAVTCAIDATVLSHRWEEMRPPNRPPTKDVSVGPLIRAARKRRGWSQRELARRADLGLRTITRIEREDPRHLVELATWQHVATALELPTLRQRVHPAQALRDALLRDTDHPVATVHFAGHGPAAATPDPVPEVQVLIGILEDAITKLATLRASMTAYAERVQELERFRARMLTAIAIDRPKE